VTEVGQVATRVYNEGGDTLVRYHNTVVVKFNDDRVILDSGGWRTQTTKNRMNQASTQYDLGYHVYQRDYTWYVDFKGDTLEFFDGIKLFINPWGDKELLEEWLDLDESEEYRDDHFFDMFEIDPDELTECPYWIEKYEGMYVQYIPGYWEPKHYGDVLEIDGIEYEYIDSVLLSEEIEHQADNGGLVYEYRGSSFLRILKEVN